MSIDLSLASCCNSLTQTSELRVRQFIIAILAWLSKECDVWHNQYFTFLHASARLKPRCTLIQPGDTTRPAVVPSETSEAVKE